MNAPARRGIRWTADEDQQIRAAIQHGANVEELAAKMNRTIIGVTCRIKMLKAMDAPELPLEQRIARLDAALDSANHVLQLLEHEF